MILTTKFYFDVLFGDNDVNIDANILIVMDLDFDLKLGTLELKIVDI